MGYSMAFAILMLGLFKALLWGAIMVYGFGCRIESGWAVFGGFTVLICVDSSLRHLMKAWTTI